LVQITITRLWRRMILQCSQIGLTLGRTFTNDSIQKGRPATGGIRGTPGSAS